MKRYLIGAAIVAVVLAGAAFAAVASTSVVDLNRGDIADVKCHGLTPSLTKTTVQAGEWNVKCHASPTPTPTPTPPPTTSPPPTGYSCVTSDPHGRCGVAWSSTSYCGYPGITGVQGGTNGGCPYVDQNEWGPISGEQQTLSANSPGDWKITSNTPVNPSGSVTTFPNVGAPFNEQPLANFGSITANITETMPHNTATSGWAMMDDWFDNWKYEIMIQHDFTRNGPCDYSATATFNNQLWGLCTFGNTAASGGAYAWKLAAPGSTVGSSATTNQGSITIDIKAMTQWLVDNGYMTANPTITNLSDGWEICSTGGVPVDFTISAYTLQATP